MIGRLLRSLSSGPLLSLFFGCIFFGVMIKQGVFPQLLMPSHDYDYVLENGLKQGQHIKGELFYSLGGFASEESYTQYENSRTASKTTGYYYMIPVGEDGIAAVFVRKADLDAMEHLTGETYEYLKGGDIPQTEVHVEGVALKMDKNLKGLESAFRDELAYLGYTEGDVDEMLSSWSDSECLVIYGPAQMSTMYVMTAIAFVLVLIGVFFLARNYRREVEYDEERESGISNTGNRPNGMSGTSYTTYYTNE